MMDFVSSEIFFDMGVSRFFYRSTLRTQSFCTVKLHRLLFATQLQISS